MIPLYQRIFEHYRQAISDGSLKHGDRLPSEFELSDEFSVSRITATRAVKELERLGLVKRIKGKGTFVHSSQEPLAGQTAADSSSSLRSRLPVISVILPYEEHYGYGILHGAEKEAKERGFYITFHNSASNLLKERDIIRQLQNDEVHGMIVYPVNSFGNTDLYADMLISRFPFVVIDRIIEYLQVPNVVSDNFQGTYDIVKHLIDLGHKNIALVGSEMMAASSVKERIKGYYRALVEAGLSFHPSWVEDIEQNLGDHSLDLDEKVRISLSKLMSLGEHAPTAIACINDITANKVLKEATLLGIKVPEHLSVTGFDNLSFCEYLEVPLTTVSQSFYSMGEQAVKLLFDNDYTAGQTKRMVLETTLIPRQSTCPPKFR